LAGALEARGLFALHVTLCEDGLWRASLETSDQYDEAEPNIAAMISAVESLTGVHMEQWQGCAVRELNSGFESSLEQRTLTQTFSPWLLVQMAAIGASLAFTVYLGEEDDVPAFPHPEVKPQVH
jgi:hypothetical protein